MGYFLDDDYAKVVPRLCETRSTIACPSRQISNRHGAVLFVKSCSVRSNGCLWHPPIYSTRAPKVNARKPVGLKWAILVNLLASAT